MSKKRKVIEELKSVADLNDDNSKMLKLNGLKMLNSLLNNNKNLDEFLISLKEKIQNIDFNDKLADKARLSLAEFYDHNDFDDGSDLSPVETENPFGPAIKDNEENTINLNEEKMSNFYESKNMINSMELNDIGCATVKI